VFQLLARRSSDSLGRRSRLSDVVFAALVVAGSACQRERRRASSR
jgi:hypothetical protein